MTHGALCERELIGRARKAELSRDGLERPQRGQRRERAIRAYHDQSHEAVSCARAIRPFDPAASDR